MRPRTLDEVVGQAHLLVPGSPLRRLVEGDGGPAGTSSVILWGPPGSGKTTLAHLVSSVAGRRFVELSAVVAGVKEVRTVIDTARHDLGASGRSTVLFVDEVHRFSKTQQDALLPAVENRWVTLVAATTENPYFSVISPLLSRSLLLTLEPLTDDDLRALVRRAVSTSAGSAARCASARRRRTTCCGSPAATRGGRSPRWRPVPARHWRSGSPSSTSGRSSGPSTGRPCATTRPATSTTTSRARSSSRSAAATSTRPCTTWRGWSRRGRTRGSSPGAS
jgi:putative ATPase